MWVEISYWQIKYSDMFLRDLIDKSKSKIQIIEYENKLYKIVAGSYGHCMDYPKGFRVKLELILDPKEKDIIIYGGNKS